MHGWWTEAARGLQGRGRGQRGGEDTERMQRGSRAAQLALPAAELSGAVRWWNENDDWSCECGRVGECVQVQLVCARKEKCGEGGLTGARGSCVAVDVRCGRRRLRIHTYLQRIHAYPADPATLEARADGRTRIGVISNKKLRITAGFIFLLRTNKLSFHILTSVCTLKTEVRSMSQTLLALIYYYGAAR